jgi:hypothetical protein
MALTKRNEFPPNFSIRDLKPGYARSRTLVGARHATGIQKQNISAPFISRDVRVPMQHNIDAIRWLVGRYMLQTDFQSTSRKIYNQRPIQIAVAISSHDRYSRPDCAKRIEYGLRADIAQMPDFIDAFSDFAYSFRQTIVRVREHENAPRLFL